MLKPTQHNRRPMLCDLCSQSPYNQLIILFCVVGSKILHNCFGLDNVHSYSQTHWGWFHQIKNIKLSMLGQFVE
uniref:Uncharacterized protein n=1 Tax=Rhizophora mucronata TaxID=61149 RepID=A0A2P2PZ60_RHIMU